MDLEDEELSPPAIDGDAPGLPLQLSDVIEAIRAADPGIIQESSSSEAQPEAPAAPVPPSDMYGGGTGSPVPVRPYIQITEQPAPRAVRFRYECEGRSAGSIPGESNTQENKTFPSVRINGLTARAVVVVSCVTSDQPYRPHPHKLVGRDRCSNGVCTVQVTPDNPVATFTNLGIQCVKKRDIEQALGEREAQRVDPYRTGFGHKHTPQSIDLNSVRLCFQAFVEENGRFRRPLEPAVSNVIYDKKSRNELTITRMSHCSAPVAGGQDVILLCEKVTKDDIVVVMREQQPSEAEPWQTTIDSVHVHRQVALVFKTPKYKSLDVDRGVKVTVQLKRPSDGETSEAREFELTPMTDRIRDRKRPRMVRVPSLESMHVPEPVKAEPREMYGQFSPQAGPSLQSNVYNYRNIQDSPSPLYAVQTPSPQQHYYAPAPNMDPSYSPQHDYHNMQWNVPLVEQTGMGEAHQAHMQQPMVDAWNVPAGTGTGGASNVMLGGDQLSSSEFLTEMMPAADQSLRQLNISEELFPVTDPTPSSNPFCRNQL